VLILFYGDNYHILMSYYKHQLSGNT